MEEVDNEPKIKVALDNFYLTGDLTHLWKVQQEITFAIKSGMRIIIKQRTGNPDTWIPNFDEKAEEGFLYFLERCKRGYNNLKVNPEAKRGGPIKGKFITYAYWIAKLLLSERYIETEKQQDFEDNMFGIEDLKLEV